MMKCSVRCWSSRYLNIVQVLVISLH